MAQIKVFFQRLRFPQVANAYASWFDFDNDGYRDLLLATEYIPSLWNRVINKILGKDNSKKWHLRLFHNQVGSGHHWLEIDLAGSYINPQAIGAKVTVSSSGREQLQQVGSSEGSRLSQGHYRLYFGLGESKAVDSIQVIWPNGQVQDLSRVDADQLLTIEQLRRV